MTSDVHISDSNESVPYRIARRARDRRYLPLRSAIHDALDTMSDAVVVDVGTGGGLLAAWAAEHPATGRVYAVEDDPLLAQQTRAALAGHPHLDRIQIVHAENLLTYVPPDQWDLLLCDVISTALLRQPQAPLVNHYLEHAQPASAVVPHALDTTATFLDLDLQRLTAGITLAHPFEDPRNLSRRSVLGSPVKLGVTRFDAPVADRLAGVVRSTATSTGWIRSIRLESRPVPGMGKPVCTMSPYSPVVIPLDVPFHVPAGNSFSLRFDLPHRGVDQHGRATAAARVPNVTLDLTSS